MGFFDGGEEVLQRMTMLVLDRKRSVVRTTYRVEWIALAT